MSGFQGKVNVYVCPDCKRPTITKDVDQGVTPFMIGCRATQNCKGMAQSSFYKVDQDLEWNFEWYKPARQEAARLDQQFPGMLEHFENGGLFLRARQRPVGILE